MPARNSDQEKEVLQVCLVLKNILVFTNIIFSGWRLWWRSLYHLETLEKCWKMELYSANWWINFNLEVSRSLKRRYSVLMSIQKRIKCLFLFCYLGTCILADGECSIFHQRCQSIRSARRGDVPYSSKWGFQFQQYFTKLMLQDLFEGRNLSQVALCIYSLARATQKHPEYQGPSLGPKFATKNERNFSEEEIRKGRDGVIGLQSGTNKGASQVG